MASRLVDECTSAVDKKELQHMVVFTFAVHSIPDMMQLALAMLEGSKPHAKCCLFDH